MPARTSTSDGSTPQERLFKHAEETAESRLRKSLGQFAGMEKELAEMRSPLPPGVSGALQSMEAELSKAGSFPGDDLLEGEKERTRSLLATPEMRTIQEAANSLQAAFQPLVSSETMKALKRMQRDLESPALRALQADMDRLATTQVPWTEELSQQAEALRNACETPALRDLQEQLDASAVFSPDGMLSKEMQDHVEALNARTSAVFAGLKMPNIDILLGRFAPKLAADVFRQQAMQLEGLLGPDIRALTSHGFHEPIVRAAASVTALAATPFEGSPATDDAVQSSILRLQEGLFATQDLFAKQVDLSPKQHKQLAWLLEFLVAYLLAKLVDYLALTGQ